MSTLTAEVTWSAPRTSTSEEHLLHYLHPGSHPAQRKFLGCPGSRFFANSPSSSLGNKLTHQMLLWHSFHLNSTNPVFPVWLFFWITKFPAYLQRGCHKPLTHCLPWKDFIIDQRAPNLFALNKQNKAGLWHFYHLNSFPENWMEQAEVPRRSWEQQQNLIRINWGELI